MRMMAIHCGSKVEVEVIKKWLIDEKLDLFKVVELKHYDGYLTKKITYEIIFHCDEEEATLLKLRHPPGLIRDCTT